jgi:hypothetical protein
MKKSQKKVSGEDWTQYPGPKNLTLTNLSCLYLLEPQVIVMPKSNPKKRNSVSQGSPYAQAAAKTKAANSIFKMNTDLGQHVLKNPGVAQAIVDKADLKQSDVRETPL